MSCNQKRRVLQCSENQTDRVISGLSNYAYDFVAKACPVKAKLSKLQAERKY